VSDATVEVGQRVTIADYSEVHGRCGVVFSVQENGIIIVELDGHDETLWPVESGQVEIHASPRNP